MFQTLRNKKTILFKYCANVENCGSFRGFGYIYIYYKKEVEQRGKKIEQGNHLLTLNSIKLT